MSSCLSSRACGFDLEHMVKWSYSRTTSNSSSPSSTLSESSNSATAISTQKQRTRRKRPNQTYNEAAALLSMASPNIFRIKHLTQRTRNLPKFTKHHVNFFNESPELISAFPVVENSGFLLRHRVANNKPCSLTGLKITNRGEIESNCVSSDVGLDDFDTEVILNEEMEEGIDSILGDCKPNSEHYESNDSIDSNFRTCYGYPVGIGFGVRSGLKNGDEGNWWDSPMVDVVNSSPAPVAVGKCEKFPGGKKKKKKKRVEEVRNSKSEFGLKLELDYEGVLNEWADKGLPLPEEISTSPGDDIHTRAANIDLFSEERIYCMDKNHPLKNDRGKVSVSSTSP